jgi:hypothetical protein
MGLMNMRFMNMGLIRLRNKLDPYKYIIPWSLREENIHWEIYNESNKIFLIVRSLFNIKRDRLKNTLWLEIFINKSGYGMKYIEIDDIVAIIRKILKYRNSRTHRIINVLTPYLCSDINNYLIFNYIKHNVTDIQLMNKIKKLVKNRFKRIIRREKKTLLERKRDGKCRYKDRKKYNEHRTPVTFQNVSSNRCKNIRMKKIKIKKEDMIRGYREKQISNNHVIVVKLVKKGKKDLVRLNRVVGLNNSKSKGKEKSGKEKSGKVKRYSVKVSSSR